MDCATYRHSFNVFANKLSRTHSTRARSRTSATISATWCAITTDCDSAAALILFKHADTRSRKLHRSRRPDFQRQRSTSVCGNFEIVTKPDTCCEPAVVTAICIDRSRLTFPPRYMVDRGLRKIVNDSYRQGAEHGELPGAIKPFSM